MVTSGLRIGTPALATRGFGEAAFHEVADIIAEALTADADADLSGLRHRVDALAKAHPLYPSLTAVGTDAR
jgi:glycine hydroxymethyltransferase